MSEKNHRVKVALRIRPFLPNEILKASQNCLSVSQNTVQMGNHKEFTFDQIFDQNSEQQEIYEHCVEELVESIFQGYNATIIAYGQTGSGKTYTMGNTYFLNGQTQGILPKVIIDVFKKAEENDQIINIKVSYLEIYNEEIYDLLDEPFTRVNKNYPIREEKDKSITIFGLNEKKVENFEEMQHCLERGILNRSTASTNMNESSSRSHAIFSITVEQQSPEEDNYIRAKFQFVDLAGSERLKRTGAIGNTQKEGININRGLLSLGNVIAALSESRIGHVPYRDSKLTRILQDSLGGNSQTYLIACASPADINYEETLNTLQYACRAQKIQNRPTINRDPLSTMIQNLKQELHEQQAENKHYKFLLEKNGIEVEGLEIDEDLADFKTLKLSNMSLQKRLDKQSGEQKFLVKGLNDMELENLKLQQHVDELLMVQERLKGLLKENSIQWEEQKVDESRKGVIENYQSKLETMKKKLDEKDLYIQDLQIELDNQFKMADKDREAFLETFEQKKKLERKIKSIENGAMEVENSDVQHKENQLEQEHIKYQTNRKTKKTKLRQVQETIEQTQTEFDQMQQNYSQLQIDLKQEMQQKYYQKITDLQSTIESMEKAKNSQGSNKKTLDAFKQKMGEYELQLKNYKRKEKEQNTLHNQLMQQKNKLSTLDTQLYQMRFQKLELTKELRHEYQKFQKFYKETQQELKQAKKQNLRKDIQINKLKNQNDLKDLRIQIQQGIIKNKKLNFNLQGQLQEESAKRLVEKSIKSLQNIFSTELQKKKEEENLQEKSLQLSLLQKKCSEVEIFLNRQQITEDIYSLQMQQQQYNQEMENLEQAIDYAESKIKSLQQNLQEQNIEAVTESLINNQEVQEGNLFNSQLLLRLLFQKMIKTQQELVSIQEQFYLSQLNLRRSQNELEIEVTKQRSMEQFYKDEYSDLPSHKQLFQQQKPILKRKSSYNQEKPSHKDTGVSRFLSTPSKSQSKQPMQLQIQNSSQKKSNLTQQLTQHLTQNLYQNFNQNYNFNQIPNLNQNYQSLNNFQLPHICDFSEIQTLESSLFNLQTHASFSQSSIALNHSAINQISTLQENIYILQQDYLNILQDFQPVLQRPQGYLRLETNLENPAWMMLQTTNNTLELWNNYEITIEKKFNKQIQNFFFLSEYTVQENNQGIMYDIRKFQDPIGQIPLPSNGQVIYDQGFIYQGKDKTLIRTDLAGNLEPKSCYWDYPSMKLLDNFVLGWGTQELGTVRRGVDWENPVRINYTIQKGMVDCGNGLQGTDTFWTAEPEALRFWCLDQKNTEIYSIYNLDINKKIEKICGYQQSILWGNSNEVGIVAPQNLENFQLFYRNFIQS